MGFNELKSLKRVLLSLLVFVLFPLILSTSTSLFEPALVGCFEGKWDDCVSSDMGVRVLLFLALPLVAVVVLALALPSRSERGDGVNAAVRWEALLSLSLDLFAALLSCFGTVLLVLWLFPAFFLSVISSNDVGAVHPNSLYGSYFVGSAGILAFFALLWGGVLLLRMLSKGE